MAKNINLKTQYSLKDDLQILTLMTNRLVDYVRGDEIYGNQGMFVSGLPVVTLGGILMRIRRLNALREHLTEASQMTLDSAILQHDKAYQDWTHHYQNKLLAEAGSRVGRIEQFVQEYQDNPRSYEVAFEPEQTRRTIVQEILYRMQSTNIENTELLEQIKDVDASLKQIVTPSNFQWAEALEEVYADDEFWWLYSTLQTAD